MTPMWEYGPDLAEIVRCQFGRKYDGSEARNTQLHQLPGKDSVSLRQVELGDGLKIHSEFKEAPKFV